MRLLRLLPLLLCLANGLVIPVRIRQSRRIDAVISRSRSRRSGRGSIHTPPLPRSPSYAPSCIIRCESFSSPTRLWSAATACTPSPPSKITSFFQTLVQIATLLALYTFHLTVLSQHVWAFPVQIGHLSSIGYDSIAGMLVTLAYWVRKSRRKQQPSENVDDDTTLPWNLPTDDSDDDEEEEDSTAITVDDEQQQQKQKQQQPNASKKRKIQWNLIRFRVTFGASVVALIKTYFQTGRLSLFWEDLLYEQSAAGWPLTVGLTRSLQVLLGHLSWVAAGTTILWLLPRPPAFFGRRRRRTNNGQNSSASRNRYRWFQWSGQNWLWWTVGGYFVSSWLFNIADSVNQFVLPAQVLKAAAESESVVTQLVQPEYNDFAALLTGYLAPCVSAPVWEEVLYRGFLLSGLHAVTHSWTAAALVQAAVFSAHHMSVTGALPLAVLAWTWAWLYTRSRNLLTVVVVHAMWNSRVFVGSWLGL